MKSIKVSDYMNTRPVTFHMDMTVAEASEKLINFHQIGGPVVNSNQEVIGFLSEQECLAHLLEDTYLSEPHSKVQDLMRTEVLTVSANDSVLELAQTMSNKKPKIYPVVDEDNRLIGVITRSNVLNAIGIHLRSFYESGHARLV